MWEGEPLTPTLGRQQQADLCKVETSLWSAQQIPGCEGYIVRPYLKIKNIKIFFKENNNKKAWVQHREVETETLLSFRLA